jgi:hypothetical protein
MAEDTHKSHKVFKNIHFVEVGNHVLKLKQESSVRVLLNMSEVNLECSVQNASKYAASVFPTEPANPSMSLCHIKRLTDRPWVSKAGKK